MSATDNQEAITLDFSQKYDEAHALHYAKKHQKGLLKRLSNWREISIAKKALAMAGNPSVVLDLPCGTGRFWPVLAENPSRTLYAADNSVDMIAVAKQVQNQAVVARVQTFTTSAFDIDLKDNAVDSIFCMRLMHHVGQKAHRLALLRELHRVTRDTVCISLWVDGNWKAFRKQAKRKESRAYQNRFVISRADIEAEFKAANFAMVGSFDALKFVSMLRIYVLRKRKD